MNIKENNQVYYLVLSEDSALLGNKKKDLLIFKPFFSQRLDLPCNFVADVNVGASIKIPDGSKLYFRLFDQLSTLIFEEDTSFLWDETDNKDDMIVFQGSFAIALQESDNILIQEPGKYKFALFIDEIQISNFAEFFIHKAVKK